MNTRLIVWHGSVLSLALSCAPAHAHEDAEEITGGGNVFLTSTEILSTRTEHDTTIVALHVTATVDGLLQGTIDSHETAKLHSDGSADVSARETFTGSINGVEGTLDMRESSKVDAAGNASSTFVIVDSGGDLAGVRGHGSLQGAGTTNTYQLTLNVRHSY